MSLGTIIRQRRREIGLTLAEVCGRVSISKAYLSRIETDRATRPPSDRVLRKLEKALGFRPRALTKPAHLARTPVDVRDELELRQTQVHKLRGMVKGLLSTSADAEAGAASLGGLLEEDPSDGPIVLDSAGVFVPIINSLAAGYPQEFTDLDYPPSVADDYVRCPDVRDPQAFAARVVGDSMAPDYDEGDIVVFSPNTPAENGNDCFVRFDGGGTTFKRFYLDDEQTIRLQPLNSRYPAQTYPRESITGLWPAMFRIQRLREP